jgi:glutamine synthetase
MGTRRSAGSTACDWLYRTARWPITNPSTNSYKRLVPGYEAPVLLAYSARNRSASCRIPFGADPKAKRVEVRFPDPSANPYLAFAAMLMAGLDGIRNKTHPGEPMDKNLYDLPPEELRSIPTVCGSLREALENLDKDRAFPTAGGVFDDDQVDSFISLKSQEVERLCPLSARTTHSASRPCETFRRSMSMPEADIRLAPPYGDPDVIPCN